MTLPYGVFCDLPAKLQFNKSLQAKEKRRFLSETAFYGAGDEARTRYLHLGKVALYRMSYTRNGHDI